MDFPLADVQNVRQIRLEAAQKELSRSRHAWEKAESEARRCREAAQAFSRERPALEQSLYDQVLTKEVERRALDELHFRLGELRQRERQLWTVAEEAEKISQERHATYQQCVSLYQERLKAREKLEEFRTGWNREQTMMAERIAEIEQEERIFQGNNQLS